LFIHDSGNGTIVQVVPLRFLELLWR